MRDCHNRPLDRVDGGGMKIRSERAKRRGACWRLLGAVALALLTAPTFAEAARARNPFAIAHRAYARGDYARAARLFEPLARRGDARAETYLGFMYENGRGVPQNMDEAARWLRSAAVAGDPLAQFIFADLWDKGFGVRQDPVTAEVWFNLAAARAGGRSRDHWERMRDEVAATLTLDELAAVRRRALAWRPGFEP